MTTSDYKSPVIFTGENPGLSLVASGSDRVIAAASFWRATYSLAGEGNALIIRYDGADGEATRAIYADNAALGRFVTATFTQHFGNFKDQGFASLDPIPARFFQDAGSSRSHRVVCHSDERTIELVWNDVRDRQQLIGSQMVLGAHSYELATVICPCGNATITIDDRPLSGEARIGTGDDGRVNSSAFLAFAESWVDSGPTGA